MLRALTSLWRKPAQITSPEELAAFLKAESAFLSQKTTVEYCRARAGLFWEKLFREAAFAEALEICRWGSMAAVLADMLVVTEAYLRPHAATDARPLGERLTRMLDEILASYASEAGPPQAGWDELRAGFPARMARVQLGAPHDPSQIARTAGARVFDLLPIHPRLRGHDREMVINSLRFGMLAFWQKLHDSIRDPEPLIRRLMTDAPAD